MITPRLEMILKHAAGRTIADIGTDHGYVPIRLAELGKKVIATDINPGPLSSAKKNIEKYFLTSDQGIVSPNCPASSNIELRLGPGIEPIKTGEADTIIIAGMGGETISNILSDDIEKAYGFKLLLQPMNYQYKLRKFLLENGFSIICEDLAKEGHKIYNLIIAQKGISALYENELEYHLPKLLYSHKLFPDLISKKKREFTKTYNGICNATDKDEAQANRFYNLLCELDALEKTIKTHQ